MRNLKLERNEQQRVFQAFTSKTGRTSDLITKVKSVITKKYEIKHKLNT
jgi:hypothetical protein